MGNYDEFISVQKLYSEVYFQEIYKYNTNQQISWINNYPHHSAWSKKAKEDLISGKRIAYGIFRLNGKTATNELFGSVMIKKNVYTPELELKNLIIFEDKIHKLGLSDNGFNEFRNDLAEKLILKVTAYAGYRGFKRITTEISQKHPFIKQFFDASYTISGTKAPKYFESDEILYLNLEVDFTYGLDPYDNFAASKWILEKNLDAKKFNLEGHRVIINGQSSNAECYSFYNGKEYEDDIKVKFNFQNHAFIVPEHLEWTFAANGGKETIEHFFNKKSSRFFIFDFTESHIGNQVAKVIDHPSVLFQRTELFSLLGRNFNSRYRFPSSKIGGLILISDPSRFPFHRAQELKNKKLGFFTYIKLGNYGQYLADDMLILLAHFSSKGDKIFRIWGAAELAGLPTTKDIKKEKKEHIETGTSDIESFTDADLLWHKFNLESDFVDEDDRLDVPDAVENFRPLWEKEDFSIHNSYNETDQVILFNLKNFQDLSTLSIAVSQVIADTATLESLKNEVEEAYLSVEEVASFTRIKKGNNDKGPNSSNSELFTPNPNPPDIE